MPESYKKNEVEHQSHVRGNFLLLCQAKMADEEWWRSLLRGLFGLVTLIRLRRTHFVMRRLLGFPLLHYKGWADSRSLALPPVVINGWEAHFAVEIALKINLLGGERQRGKRELSTNFEHEFWGSLVKVLQIEISLEMLGISKRWAPGCVK